MDRQSLVFAGIVPHPPIMVPEIGRHDIAQVSGSIEAMRVFTARLLASGAETAVIISPHAPLEEGAFVAYPGPSVSGDFARFQAPQLTLSAPYDDELLGRIAFEVARAGYEILRLPVLPLDHGTAVPLYFLQRNGWSGPVVTLGYSFLSDRDHLRFGLCVRRAAETLGRSIAFIASGDLSHRLKPDAPAGYDPTAHLFDEAVVAAIESGLPERIAEIDPGLRRRAGECGYRSMLVALGAMDELDKDCEVLNYEAPFGVGYLVAQLVNVSRSPHHYQLSQADDDQEASPSENNDEGVGIKLLSLARQAVETYIKDNRVIAPPAGELSPFLQQRASCFVSLKTLMGELRGCIGTVYPERPTLADEVIANAINAATHDPRFLPVTPGELKDLRYSVDILTPPELTDFSGLQPETYGVIVEGEAGRRGLLLPDLPGVETAEQQVEIAARKAGLELGPNLRFYRFRVNRFRETAFD